MLWPYNASQVSTTNTGFDMTVRANLRTIDLAQAEGISVQLVRNYEASGMIPTAQRTPSGYRRYTQQHLDALRAARQMAEAYGSPTARQIMRAVHEGAWPQALAMVDERHAQQAAARAHLAQTQAALGVLAAHPPAPHAAAPLRVGAAAQLVGIRISALRFWEQQGLVRPARERGSNYRTYDERQIRRLRAVALLRQAGYDFETIRTTLDELEHGTPQRAVAAIQQRRATLAAASWRAMAALAALHAYMRAHLGDPPPHDGGPAGAIIDRTQSL